jgi:hypothetical protein
MTDDDSKRSAEERRTDALRALRWRLVWRIALSLAVIAAAVLFDLWARVR